MLKSRIAHRASRNGWEVADYGDQGGELVDAASVCSDAGTDVVHGRRAAGAQIRETQI